MLADVRAKSLGHGSLAPGVHKPGTFLRQIVHFITRHLAAWRDHPDRRSASSEKELTAQLKSHLDSQARQLLDVIQFSTEVPDTVQRGRSLDMAAQPSGGPIIVEGRRYTQFDVLLPIECKRLPTPPDKGRDEREYVITRNGSTTGGIQRFKSGAHGAAFSLALIIGYIQQGDPPRWLQTINGWLTEVGQADASWKDEELVLAASDVSTVTQLHSRHRRDVGQGPIDLVHLWISMFR